ncbi:hypothetical protein L0Y49_02580 [bacterium]|nr:hypothetical protein [bacterium]MCI0566532.1 hypothetical protein [bacterium]
MSKNIGHARTFASFSFYKQGFLYFLSALPILFFIFVILPSGGDVAASSGASLKRGYNHDTTCVGNTCTAVIHGKWINWLDADEEWKPINTDFREEGGEFVMDAAPFKFYAPSTAAGVARMVNDNRFDAVNKENITESPFIMKIQAREVNDVPGRMVRGDIVTPAGPHRNVSYILYEGAYPEGDLIYYIDFGIAPRLAKLVRINSTPTKTMYTFFVSYDEDIDVGKVTGRSRTAWNRSAQNIFRVEHGDRLSIHREGSAKRGIGLRLGQVWDSNLAYQTNSKAERNIEKVSLTLASESGNSYLLTKDISSFLDTNPVYPVYTDTYASFNPDADSETTSVDGRVADHEQNKSWTDTHDSATGNYAFDNEVEINTSCYYVGSSFGYSIQRGFILFDTSSIPDDSTITLATTSLYFNSRSDGNSDGDGIGIVQSRPASITSLSTGDFDSFDQLHGDAVASSTQILAITAGQYTHFQMATTSLNWISSTSTTKLGVRHTGDYTENSSHTNDACNDGGLPQSNTANFASADETGTSKDPILGVVYSVSSDAPLAPTDLLTEEEINPTQVVDTTPEFSAIFRDGETGDVATSYQIQVATSSSDFTSPFWNSGKTTLSSTTPVDNRIPDISYDGSALTASTTYYWRIRFWDNDDFEGAWSTTTASFVLFDVALKARKSADQSKTNSTLVDDNHLQLGLQPSASYIIDGVIMASSTSATPDIKVAFVGPSGAITDIGYIGASGTTVRGAEHLISSTTSTVIRVVANTATVVQIHGTVQTTSGGVLKLQWAQNTTNANETRVLRGSYLRAEEI